MINVTKTYLPDKKKYFNYIEKIYSSHWLTNNGPLVQKLEQRLVDYLGVKNVILVGNGTIALEVAYKTLDIKGDAVTTPFSFVATTSSLLTNNINPIYADIDSNTFNIDPKIINDVITTNTTCIVPVHVFGNPCDVNAINKIAQKYRVKVIYDAAHAFDVKINNKSILNFGDISVLSFHATKLFHTIEGGALIINDDSLIEKARSIINFGISKKHTIQNLGINGKMNEFEAAMGLCVLDDIEYIINQRKKIYTRYQKALSPLVKIQIIQNNVQPNYSYFPIVLKTKQELLDIQKLLNKHDIFPRRYFYPSLDTLYSSQQNCQISRDISNKILCLPIYPDLKDEEQNLIIQIIKDYHEGV